jgi:tetratricopeptide (TPR) repeat protein
MESGFHAQQLLSIPSKKLVRKTSLLSVACWIAVGSFAQGAQQNPTLQQQYDKAQSLQSAGSMEQAAFAYQVFLASAIDELASDGAKIGDSTLAAKRFEEAYALHGADDDLLLRTAQAESDAGNLGRARELAEKLLSAQPRSAEAHRLLADILMRSGDNDRAVKEDEAAVAIDPSIENGFALAKAYLMKKDDKAAAKVFAELLAGTGDTAAAHMDIGRAYGEAGYPDEAIVEFKKALAKNPSLPGLHYCLGAAYLLSMGEIDFPKAAAEFHKELALHPNDFLSHSQLGYIDLNRHNYAEAEHELQRAAQINPRDPDTLLSLGQLYVDTNRPADAEAVLRKSIALTTDLSRNHYQVQRAHYLLGRVLLQTGHAEDAKAEMQASTDLLKLSTLQNQGKSADEIAAAARTSNVRLDRSAPPVDAAAQKEMDELEKRLGPAIADSYNNLGAITAHDGDFPAAVRDFQHAAEWNPSLDGLDYNLARAAYSAKDYAAAVAPLDRYLKQKPDDTWFRSALGVSLFMTGDYARSVETLRPIQARLQSSAQLSSIYAAALVESGDFKEGIARLQQLEAADPGKPEFHRMLGKAWQRSGDDARAEEELRTALRLDPKDTDSQQRLALLQQSKASQPQPAPK